MLTGRLGKLEESLATSLSGMQVTNNGGVVFVLHNRSSDGSYDALVYAIQPTVWSTREGQFIIPSDMTVFIREGRDDTGFTTRFGSQAGYEIVGQTFPCHVDDLTHTNRSLAVASVVCPICDRFTCHEHMTSVSCFLHAHEPVLNMIREDGRIPNTGEMCISCGLEITKFMTDATRAFAYQRRPPNYIRGQRFVRFLHRLSTPRPTNP